MQLFAGWPQTLQNLTALQGPHPLTWKNLETWENLEKATFLIQNLENGGWGQLTEW